MPTGKNGHIFVVTDWTAAGPGGLAESIRWHLTGPSARVIRGTMQHFDGGYLCPACGQTLTTLKNAADELICRECRTVVVVVGDRRCLYLGPASNGRHTVGELESADAGPEGLQHPPS